jgi:hypothetical protein
MHRTTSLGGMLEFPTQRVTPRSVNTQALPNPLSLTRFASKSFVSAIVEGPLIQIDEGMFV